MTAGSDASRAAQLRRGVRLEAVTVGCNALEGVIAIAAGLAAGSVALTGFGLDSVIEVTSGAVLPPPANTKAVGTDSLPAAKPKARRRVPRWGGGTFHSRTGFTAHVGQLSDDPNEENTMSQLNLGRGVTAGAVGTAAITILMLSAPMMGMPKMPIVDMLGSFLHIGSAGASDARLVERQAES